LGLLSVTLSGFDAGTWDLVFVNLRVVDENFKEGPSPFLWDPFLLGDYKKLFLEERVENRNKPQEILWIFLWIFAISRYLVFGGWNPEQFSIVLAMSKESFVNRRMLTPADVYLVLRPRVSQGSTTR
jgi:hypothetical protein